MQWTVYWDRPQNLINEYISSIEGFISFAFPNWGSQNEGYTLRASTEWVA